jgi:hypothetical protein
MKLRALEYWIIRSSRMMTVEVRAARRNVHGPDG